MWTSSQTYIYDAKLRTILERLHDSWEVTVSYTHRYNPVRSGYYIFSAPLDIFSSQQQKDWDTINSARRALKQHLDGFVKLIRENYLEIDLDKTSADAWKRYRRFIQEIEKENPLLLRKLRKSKPTKKRP